MKCKIENVGFLDAYILIFIWIYAMYRDKLRRSKIWNRDGAYILIHISIAFMVSNWVAEIKNVTL